ncbi:MAG TPA: MBL fold metallo-hydrolase, partial [Anaerolineae bacterium]|nr:MBL fold metallo-hydrolase [Anaerolineae bacterium]
LQMLSGLAEFVAGFTYSSIAVENITPLFGVSFAAWLYVISRAQGRYNFQKAILYIPLMLLLLYTWNMPALTSLSGRKSGSVVFYDVGQGDAALVTYGHTHHFLVDTGPQYTHGDAGTSVIVPNLKSAGITHLDGVFLSHTHADHTGGLNSILKNIRVDHIFCRQSIADSLKALFGDSVFGISAGDSIAFKEGGILILSPWSALQKKSSVGENDCSLLIRFDLYGVRLLFPGDIEEKIQHHLLAWKAALESDILKVPHHGAPDLYSEFIRVIHPMVTIISCGADNRYNHPAETTLVILEKSGCKVYRTDRDGTIQITLPALHISTF